MLDAPGPLYMDCVGLNGRQNPRFRVPECSYRCETAKSSCDSLLAHKGRLRRDSYRKSTYHCSTVGYSDLPMVGYDYENLMMDAG